MADNSSNLPPSISEYIDQIIKKMRYRKKIRREVEEELTAHFEDALRHTADMEEKMKIAGELINEFGDVETLAKLIRRGKKRCRTLFQKINLLLGQSICAAFILCIVYIVWFFMGKPTPSVDYLARLNELNKSQISQQDNAWPIYQQAIDVYVKPDDADEDLNDEKLSTIIDRMKKRDTEKFKSLTQLSADKRQRLLEWLKANQESWQLYKLASGKEYLYKPYNCGDNEDNMLIGVMLTHIAPLRDVAVVGMWNIEKHLMEDNIKAAVEESMVLIRVGRHVFRQITLIESLVGISISTSGYSSILRILERQDLHIDTLNFIHSQLSQFDNSIFDKNWIEGERMMFIDAVQYVFTDGGPGGGHIVHSMYSDLANFSDDEELISMATIFLHAGRRETLRKANEIYDNLEQFSTMTPYEAHVNNIKSIDELLSGESFYRYNLIHVFMPPLDRVMHRVHQYKATKQAAEVIVASHLLKKQNGSWPQDINQLKDRGLIKEIPIDPYSDKPLVYKITDSGFTLYSLGQDFEDDGGKVNDKEPWGGRGEEADGDRVFWPLPEP